MGARDPFHATVDDRVAAVAARQYGLITRAQAAAAGLTPDMTKSRLKNGSFIRIHRGVYRLRGTPPSWRQNVLAVVLWGGDEAVASHGTAAKLWGFPVSPSAIEITVRGRREAPNASIRIHRGVVAARTSVDGIPVTNAARTLLDISARLTPPLLESLVDDAITRRLASPASLEWELQVAGGRGRSGSKAFRAAVAHLSDGRCESVLENKVLRVLLQAGLPLPLRQYEIKSGDFMARVDFAYPQGKLAIEVDGFRYHSGRHAFEKDRRSRCSAKSDRVDGDPGNRSFPERPRRLHRCGTCRPWGCALLTAAS